jgi:DnaK suppressor protein
MPKTQKSSEPKSPPAAKRAATAPSSRGGTKRPAAAEKATKATKAQSHRDSPPAAKAAASEQASRKKAAEPAPAKSKVAPAKKAAPQRQESHRSESHRSAPAKADAPSKAAAKRAAEDDEPREQFLSEQRVLLAEERESYTRQANELKAAADSLALEHEPGDVQFDEEGGEGGTSNVDRELDLVLSAQALAAIGEIDRALRKLDAGTYGVCEQCGNPIPQARLKALPYAALCVSCKSGGLSRR